MKKALLTLAFSLMVLMFAVAYDITKYDGEVFFNQIMGIERTPDIVINNDGTENVSETPSSGTYADKKLSVTAPRTEEKIVETTVDEEEGAELPEEVEVNVTSDADRGYEYYFPLLSGEEQAVYRSMYDAFREVKSGNTIPSADDESMNRAVIALKNDHPELFYMDQIGYTHYTMGGQIQRTTLSVTYSDNKSMIETKQRMVDTVASEIIASIPSDADDYTKVKMVYEAIINNTTYNAAAPDNQTIVSALVNKSSVCAGYARSMQYILNKIGVPTTVVEGTSLFTGEQHAWNLCKLEDGYYYVDVTWGDASYTNNGRGGNIGEQINYDYLLLTTEEIERTHGIDSIVPLPECNQTANNYFVREGLYLMSYDYNQVKAMFDRGYAEGLSMVTFKCASLEIYDEAYNNLVKKSQIFDMLSQDAETISYVVDEEQRTLCFWL